MDKPWIADAVAVVVEEVGHVARSFSDPLEFDVQMENLAELIVDLIAGGEASALRAAYEGVERLYAITRPAEGDGDARCGQLRALTTLLAIASAKPGRAEITSLAGRHQRIVLALLHVGTAVENSALVLRTGHDKAVVSRALRELRAAGLVMARRQWRSKLNELTPRGREIALTLRPAPASAAPPLPRQD